MGFRETIRRKRMEYAKQRAETKGYRRIVAEKTKLASRQAYAKEAVKVAEQRAIAKARQPTFGQKLSMVGKNMSRPQAVKRTAAVRKTIKRKAAKVVKTATRRAKKKRYSSAPVYQAPRTPQSLNQAIYGGY